MAQAEANNRMIEYALGFLNIRRTQIEQSIGDRTDEQTRRSRHDGIDRIDVQLEVPTAILSRW